MNHTRTRLLLAVPAALLAATSLVGCGLAEKAAEDAAKDSGVDLDIDDGKVEIDTTDGGATVGKLPKGFPTDEVSVVDGEILIGSSTKSPDTWTTTIKVGPAGGDKAGAYSTAEETLTGGGAETLTPSADNGTGIFGQYGTSTYIVDLSVTDSNGIVVTYVVAPK